MLFLSCNSPWKQPLSISSFGRINNSHLYGWKPSACYCCFYMSRHSLFFNIFMQVILIELSILSNFVEAFWWFWMSIHVRIFAWIFQGISISVYHDYCNNLNKISLIYIEFLGNALLISNRKIKKICVFFIVKQFFEPKLCYKIFYSY